MAAATGTVKTFRGRRQGIHTIVTVHRGKSQYGLRSLLGRSENYQWGPGRDPEPLAVALLASTFGQEDAMCYVCEGTGTAKPDGATGVWTGARTLLPKVLRAPCPDCGGSGLNPMLERVLPQFCVLVSRFEPVWEITDTEIMGWAVEHHRSVD